MSDGPVRRAEYGQPNKVSVDDMLHEISSQSVAVAAVAEQIQEQLAELDPAPIREASHVYITGCGDSYFAGIAARLAFHRFGRVLTEPLEALEFSRYVSEFIPEKSVLFAISNSGKATRTVESAICGRQSGAFTIAITGNSSGWLAQEADTYLDQSVRVAGKSLTMPSNLEQGAQRASFGLANFLASLTTLYLVAFHFGKVRGVLTEQEAAVLTEEVRSLAGNIDETIEQCRPVIERYASEVAGMEAFTILGAGPAHAMALFYGAKTYELPRVNGIPQELEEWAHEQYFLTKEGTQIIIIAPPGRSYSRALELLSSAKTMGARTIVVTDEAGQEASALADLVFPVAGRIREEFMALPYCVPGELFATFIAQVRGRNAFEFDSELQYIMNMRTIQESAVHCGRSQALS
jgi:glutamine---fructose-6-phosphate transaminase (isomerizing)